MGKGCKIVNSSRTSFGSEPYLIRMGDHVEISGNVTFITHDGAVWVLRQKHPEIDVFGEIVIGNNVFVGNVAILLPGTQIGDNCVIGAGALVKGQCDSNGIYAGVPARRIGEYEDYERRSLQASVPTKLKNPAEKRSFLMKHFGYEQG